jgi:hypothetical protein
MGDWPFLQRISKNLLQHTGFTETEIKASQTGRLADFRRDLASAL